MLALLLDHTAPLMVDRWAMIGGSGGKGVAAVTGTKLTEMIHDVDPAYDYKAHSLSEILTWLHTHLPNDINDGMILHLKTKDSLPGKESVVQVITNPQPPHDLMPIMLVDNEKSGGAVPHKPGYLVVRYIPEDKDFRIVSEAEPFKARIKMEYRFYNGVPTALPARDQIFINVHGWTDAEFATCIKSWMDVGTGMGIYHEGTRTRQLEEVNGNAVSVRGTNISKGNLDNDQKYISIRELGGRH